MQSLEYKDNLKRNISIYKKTSYLTSMVFMWCIMTLYFNYKGLGFTEIALLQSIGAIFEIILEIPTGWLSDRRGHAFVLKISSVSRIVAVFFLLVFKSFYLLVISELFFALASSAQSGANTALLYESFKNTEGEERYSSFLADIRGKQAIIRLIIKIITPLFFSFYPNMPIILSATIYLIITYYTFKYTSLSEQLYENENDNAVDKKDEKILSLLKKHKIFIICSILSAIVFVTISNYSQFIGPFLKSKNFNVALLGIVYAIGSFGEFLGSKITKKIGGKDSIFVLFILSIIIFVFCILGGVIPNVSGGAIAYFGINLINTPFSILMNEQINRSISSRYRATLLSVSNQVDQFLSIVTDPIIGYAIDSVGFNRTYILLGCASIIVVITLILILELFVKRSLWKSE